VPPFWEEDGCNCSGCVPQLAEALSYNPSVVKGTVMGSFFDQQYQQQVDNCVEVGQPSDGIDRNGRLVQVFDKKG
jgi:hypothetical protein